MCPACIWSPALTVAGVTSRGGLAVFALRSVGATWARSRNLVDRLRAGACESKANAPWNRIAEFAEFAKKA